MSGAAEPRLKARFIFQLLRRRARRLFLSLAALAFLFAGIAVLQHWFVRAQLYRTTRQQLGLWAAEVAEEIAYKDKWDLEGYRRASIAAPSWYVITRDGLIIDIEGFTPGIIDRVQPLDESIYTAPRTILTMAGETWRLFGRKVLGGVVILGLCAPESIPVADARLLANSAKFGPTLEKAASISSRELDFDVDYAVVGLTGEIKAAWGGVPLKTDPNSLPVASNRLAPLVVGGKPYLLYFERIRDGNGGEVGTVILPKDMSLEERALRVQDRFNLWVVAVAALLACTGALLLAVQELLSQSWKVPLDEALKIGESRTVEFKSTFQWDLRRDQYVEERRLDVLKSIAGFLNAEGGTLFIGVSEETNPPALRGLDEDLGYVGGSKDKLQRTLRDLITTRIGPEFSPLIRDSLEETVGRFYWAVAVKESPEPAFVRWKAAGEAKERKRFYVREGSKTSDLDNESTWHYIKNKWG